MQLPAKEIAQSAKLNVSNLSQEDAKTVKALQEFIKKVRELAKETPSDAYDVEGKWEEIAASSLPAFNVHEAHMKKQLIQEEQIKVE